MSIADPPPSLFGGPRILSLWDGLAASPILTDYTWSPLVQSAVSRNFAVLHPSSPKSLLDVSTKSTLHGLVAIHLRRGDYARHCTRLASWGSLYMGINQLHSLPDRFTPPPSPKGGDRAEVEAYYMQHCLPEVVQVVERLRTLRKEHPGLRRVYALSNGWGWWLNELKKALLDDGWASVASSLDVQLDAEQHYVSMAVDMAIAEKAEVFVGNGASSCLPFAAYVLIIILLFIFTVLKFDLEYCHATGGQGFERHLESLPLIFSFLGSH